jgi:hypothetical protein
MQRIRRIGPLSLAKIQGVMFLVIGLIIGVLYGVIIGIAGIVTLGAGEEEGMIFMILGAVSIIVFPVIYAAMGFLMGALMAWAYNLAARYIGGLEVELIPGEPGRLEPDAAAPAAPESPGS